MLSLIYKDIILQKKMFLFALGYAVFLFFAFRTPEFVNGVYVMGSFAIAYLFLLTSVAWDDKNKSEIILNSLPVRREDIVKAKYLFVLVSAALGIAIMGVTGLILKKFGLATHASYLGWPDALESLTSVAFLSAIYLPFYYRFGSIYMKIINVVIFMLVFFLPSFILGYVREHPDQRLVAHTLRILATTPEWLLILTVCALVFGLMAGSMLIAIRVYRKKDL